MKTRFVVSVAVALAIIGTIFGVKFAGIRRAMAAAANRPTPTVTVSAASAQPETWPNTVQAIGSIASFRGITVKAELDGIVQKISAKSGALVEQGDVLVEFDTSVETAQLAGLDAQARLAEANLTRARELRANGTNTPLELDTAEAALRQTRAAVEQMRATLAKKRIVAPFAGRLGIVKIHPGQYLARADAIVDLETLDRVYADFAVPQQDLSRVAVGQPIHVRVDAHPGRVFEGIIEAVAPRVSDTTRTLSVRALLPNQDQALLPGMFGNVEVVLGASENVVTLPTAAVVYNPYGNFVYVIDNGVARQRFVGTGAQRGNLVSIASGLKAGEQVVTSGQIKLRNGVPVRVDNSAAPSANPAPKPSEG